MDFLKWSRHRFWIKISHFIDKTTMQFPITVLLLPILFYDWHWLAIIPLAITIDLSIHASMFLHQHYFSYKKLKESMGKCLNGNLEFIETPLIDHLKQVVKLAFSRDRMIKYFAPDIKVIKSDKIKYKFTTIPDLTGTSIVVVRKRFNENEIRDIVLLAHEFGHVTHSLLRYERYMIPAVSFIYQTVLLVYALLFGGWTLFLLLLPINGFLTWKNINEFESRIEINADTLALQYIETLWNAEAMHTAASYLIRLRIESSSKMKRGMAQFAVDNCIFVLSSFISPSDRMSLINASNERSRIFEGDESLDHRTKVDKLSNELLIRNNLQISPIRESSLNPPLVMDAKSGFSIILYITSLVTAILSLTCVLKEVQYNWGWIPILVSIILALILLVTYQRISTIIWNKKTKMQAQIGL